MIKFKSVITLLMVTIILLMGTTSIFAETTNPTKGKFGIIVPKEIRDADIQSQINKRIKELEDLDNLDKQTKQSITPNSRAIYTSVKVDTKYKTISGEAGGQPSNGYGFPTGGGFWFVDSGGPTASGSVSFSVPYKLIEISVSLGFASDNGGSGLFVTVPPGPYRYKLNVSKTMQVEQINIYRQETSSSPKVLWDILYPETLYNQDQWAKRV